MNNYAQTQLPYAMDTFSLHKAYTNAELNPRQVLADIRARANRYTEYNIWIHLLNDEELSPYLDKLPPMDTARYPLWGIPFAIKDNLDLAGIPTTAACKAFSYTPSVSAVVVQKLIDAGAIPVGKTNMDQFATGLNGTRSPWGACRNAFNQEYISGGSSSGSAVAVALGLASFSLGTDTAGSGRVPACFNNLVGLKPTRGLLSASGLVPACKSLDCITVFAYNTEEANSVLAVTEGFDGSDAYSRANPYHNQSRQFGIREGKLIIGVIAASQLNFFGDQAYAQAYTETCKKLSESNIELVEIDYSAFAEAAKLLYEGPWVAERYLAIETLLQTQPEAVFPVVRDIIEPGGEPRATELFQAQYRLHALKTQCDQQLDKLDCLLTPTAGKCFSIDELLAEPITRNSQLGFYTNFMNLLDLASIAVPTQIATNGLPFGVTLVGKAFSDRALLAIASRLQKIFPLNAGASDFPALAAASELDKKVLPSVGDKGYIDVAVCGAHLSGLPLNWQLSERGAYLHTTTQTAARYRMYVLAGGPPLRPGLVLDDESGSSIEVEVWRMPAAVFGKFVDEIPAPLGIGKVQLHNGRVVSGFICEPYAIQSAEEITAFGAWRRYLLSIE